MEDIAMILPAVALRGMTILPGMIAHFDISREISIKAVEESMRDEQRIFLVTQRNVEQSNPGLEDLYNCLLYTSPSPRDRSISRMPSSA